VDSGGEELPRKKEIIEREEAGIAEGDEGYGAIRKVQPHETADHQAAKHKAGGGERDGWGIQIPRAATARYPLATRPSSENWKKRSTEGRPLGHALACERSITLFYQRAGLPTALDFETVLPKQFSGGR